MRILHSPEMNVPAAASAPIHFPEITPAAVPAIDQERMDSLEQIAKALLQRLAQVEERLSSLEAQRAEKPSLPERKSEPAPPAPVTIPPLIVDAEALKKGLLTKMWKYMNDEQPTRTI
jgi:hypothetical protein